MNILHFQYKEKSVTFITYLNNIYQMLTITVRVVCSNVTECHVYKYNDNNLILIWPSLELTAVDIYIFREHFRCLLLFLFVFYGAAQFKSYGAEAVETILANFGCYKFKA
jgi:hypothetical protein